MAMRLLLAVMTVLVLGALPAFAAGPKNDSFETGDFADWQSAGSGWRVSAYKLDVYRGRYGAVNEVPIGGGDEFRIIHQQVKCAPGKTYEAGVWLRAVCIEQTESCLEIQFLDRDGKVLKQFQSRRIIGDQEFTLVTIEKALAPDKTSYASIRGVVHVIKPPETNADYHIFDNFTFRRARN